MLGRLKDRNLKNQRLKSERGSCQPCTEAGTVGVLWKKVLKNSENSLENT